MNFGSAQTAFKGGKSMNIENSKPSINFTHENDLLVSLGDKYSEIEKFVDSRYLMKDINKLLIRFGTIVFDDGTAWNPASGWYKFITQESGQTIKIDAPEIFYHKRSNSK